MLDDGEVNQAREWGDGRVVTHGRWLLLSGIGKQADRHNAEQHQG